MNKWMMKNTRIASLFCRECLKLAWSEIYMRIEKKNGTVLRKCGEFSFLINAYLSYNNEDEDIFQINETGELIWKLIDSEELFDDIVKKIIEYYEEDSCEIKNEIYNDTLTFLKEMEYADLVKIYD